MGLYGSVMRGRDRRSHSLPGRLRLKFPIPPGPMQRHSLRPLAGLCAWSSESKLLETGNDRLRHKDVSRGREACKRNPAGSQKPPYRWLVESESDRYLQRWIEE